MAEHSILSDKVIRAYRDAGKIIIEPFNNNNLKTSSYDVSLGEWYYREQPIKDIWGNIYNIYSEQHVRRIWGEPEQAKHYKHYQEHGINLENIDPNEKIIWINSGETILGHTIEFIGGTNSVTTMMKSRSSMGRNFIECCKCAGWGDCGYFNRWTMEITNNSTKYKIPLVVGRRVAQIVFFETDGIESKNYNSSGKYQNNQDINELIKSWQPSDMLPKMYLDRENRN